MSGRITLSALLEMLADAAAMDAGKSDIMDKLQTRADNAKAFEARAAPCLAAVEAAAAACTAAAMEAAAPTAAADTKEAQESATAADASVTMVDTDGSTAAADSGAPGSAALQAQPAKITLAELESLVQDGQAIGIKLDSLTELTRLLHTARAWSQQAEYCLTGKEPHIGKHKRNQPQPSLQKVNSLVSELQYFAVLLPQAEDLCKRQQEACNWVEKAARVLQQDNLGRHLPDVQAVVHQGAAFALEMPELTQLDALVRAIEWNNQVKQALRLSTAPPHAVLAQQQQQQVTAQPPEANKLQVMQQESQSALPEVLKAEASTVVGRPEGDRGSPFPAGPSAQASGSGPYQNGKAISMPERLTLSEAEVLAEQGQNLPVDPAALQDLVELVEGGQRWEMQASMHGHTYTYMHC